MTSPHYRGEGGENFRHRVTGGVSTYNIWYDAIVKYCRMTSQIDWYMYRYTVPVETGRGEGRRCFSLFFFFFFFSGGKLCSVLTGLSIS